MYSNTDFIRFYKKVTIFAVVLSMCLTLIQGVTVSAEDILFNLSDGAIRIESGTSPNTIKVIQGDVTEDNIPEETQVTITGTYSSNSGDAIYVAPGIAMNIKLSNTNINSHCAFNMSGASVNLELSGENTLQSSNDSNAGLKVSGGASVIIYGDGSLTTGKDGYCGTGIGGDSGNITINGGKITAIGYWGAGIGVGSGNITINGGTVNATGRYGAGIGGMGWSNFDVNITINGGTIIASGGSYAAGIGSGYLTNSTKNGSITINGGEITATGSYGAAIGSGGYNGLSCPITINGGMVNANSIGGTGFYSNSPDNGAFTMNGNAIVFASSVSGNLHKTKGILFIGNSGTVYGNVTLEENTTIPSSRTLTIPNSSSLLIPEEITLINNGIVKPSNGSTMTVFGLVLGNKIESANVTALSANRITHNSVKLNAADLLAATGQDVEYAFSTSNLVPSSGWQNTPYFTALNPETTYYFFARSREDTNFRAGMASSLPVTILCAGDINQDNAINMADIMEIAKVFNTISTSEKFNPDCDLNRDNAINMADIMIVVAHFNQIIK